jgi:competence protein ComEC
MSFAAVTGLIAFYEHRRLTQRRRAPDDEPVPARNVILVYFLGVLLTTLIASVATTPFAAFHFQRIATFGIVANLVAVPLTAFWIMPAGLVAMLLMPFGLDAPFLVVMGHGIRIVLDVAALMAQLPGSVIDVPPWPTFGLMVMVAGGLWLCLWRGKWRRWGFAMAALGVVVVLLARPADLLIDRRGDFVAYRAADGTAHLLERQRDNWLSRQMLQGLGVAEALPFATSTDSRLRCDPLGCLIEMTPTLPLALSLVAEAVAEDCAQAAFVVLLSGPESCAGATPSLGQRALWQSGGVALRWRGARVTIERVVDERGERPWTR